MVEKITCKKVYENQKDYLLLDVRTHTEYGKSHIENSLNVSNEFLLENKKKIEKNKKHIVFICRSGGRASVSHCKLNFKNSFVMDGGMIDWEKSYKTIKNNNIWDIERQVRFVVGSFLIVFGILGIYTNSNFFYVSIAFGVGLTFASLTNSCMMGYLLTKLWFNKANNKKVCEILK